MRKTKFFVYIIESDKGGRYYTGQTEDLDLRVLGTIREGICPRKALYHGDLKGGRNLRADPKL